AGTIAVRCSVAVRHGGVPQLICSQSAKPVSAVGAAAIRPPTSASQAAGPSLPSATPALPSTASPVASVNIPTVASVRGGCTGWPDGPCRTRPSSLIAALYTKGEVLETRRAELQQDPARASAIETAV